jgi:hypothetical protein
LLVSCGQQQAPTAHTDQKISTKSYQRFVSISGTPTALDTKTGQQCVISNKYNVDGLPLCVNLFSAYPD